MKLLLTLGFLSFFSNSMSAQSIDTATTPIYMQMMQDRKNNFYAVQSAFKKYWDNNPYQPQSGYKVFKRWEWFWASRVNADGTFPESDKTMKEYKKFLLLNSDRSANGNWTELGPRKKPSNATGQPVGLGRVNCIAFDPLSVDIIFVGAPQGGLWKTTDGGVTWAISGTDQIATLGVSSIAIDPSNSQIMYIGTGDRDAGDAQGKGVYKSTNGGASWTASNAGTTGLTVSRILINPLNPSAIIIGTSNGLYQSYNAGVTWIKRASYTSHMKEMKYKPGDTNTIYATGNGSFFRSTNGGAAWSQISAGFGTGISRMVITVCPAAPSKVYAVCSNSSRTFQAFYMSNNSGTSFYQKAVSPSNILGSNAAGNDTKGQGEYDLALGVDPLDPKIVYVGGINIFQSNDTGANFTCVAHWTGSSGIQPIHADQHIFEFSPMTQEMYAGNDGGLYTTPDQGQSWNDLSNGLGISQVYKIGQNPLNPKSVINGYQDNGTSIYSNGFTYVIGGDGMECIIDYQDTTYSYGALYYGEIRRVKGGFSTQVAGIGVNGITESGGWITPYALYPTNTNTMVVGYKNIWRSINIKASTPSFTKVSTSGTSDINVVEFSAANNKYFYYSTNTSLMYRTTDITAASVVWDNVPTPEVISAIETHPTDVNRLWMSTWGNKIYKSSNRGTTWTDISANLPNISINTILMDIHSKEGIYVGTDAGVYYKDSTMTNWILYNTNLPANSQINELEAYYHPLNSNLNRITAGTYGRGTWQGDMYITQTQPNVDFYSKDTSPCVGGLIKLRDTSSPSCDQFLWSITPASFAYANGTNATSRYPEIIFTASGNYSVTLFAKAYGLGYDTTTKTSYFKVGTKPVVTLSAPSQNNFCVGDSALITASGALTYSWSPASKVSNASTASTYLKPTVNTTYLVTGYAGAGCSDTESVFITVKPTPTVTIAGAATICPFQPVVLTATSTSAITWSPSLGLNTTSGSTVTASPNVTTTYMATTAMVNGCSGSAKHLLTVSQKPTITVVGNRYMCTGGNCTLTASGANNLVWNPTFGLSTPFGGNVVANPTATTPYRIIGNNANNCYDTTFVTINVVTAANVLLTQNKPEICIGDTAIWKLSGSNTYIYTPTTDVTKKNDSVYYLIPTTPASTSYQIEGTVSAACKATKAFDLISRPVPSVNLSASSSSVIKGSSTTLTASGANTYSWSPSATLSSSSGAIVTATPTDTTTYTVIGTNQYNCASTTTIQIIVIPYNSIISTQNNIKVYPNPTSQYLMIEVEKDMNVDLKDLFGKNVASYQLHKGPNKIDISMMSKGSYILYQNNNERVKIVIE
jgi:photosystem II stability/assembly factor-like uncharacterized protein